MPAPAPDPVGPPPLPPAPVFVDDTGRRHRFVRRFGWILAAVIAVYLGLLTVSLVGSPGLVPLSLPAVGDVLPGPAAPLVSDGARTGRAAGELVPTAATPAAHVPAGAATVIVSATPAGNRRQQGRARSGSSSTTAPTASAPATAASPAPATSPTAQGKAAPATSPRPSSGSSTHPTPHSTHAAGVRPTSGASPVATATP